MGTLDLSHGWISTTGGTRFIDARGNTPSRGDIDARDTSREASSEGHEMSGGKKEGQRAIDGFFVDNTRSDGQSSTRGVTDNRRTTIFEDSGSHDGKHVPDAMTNGRSRIILSRSQYVLFGER